MAERKPNEHIAALTRDDDGAHFVYEDYDGPRLAGTRDLPRPH